MCDSRKWSGASAGGRALRNPGAKYIAVMLNPTPLWREFERRDAREAYASLTYEQALRRFEAMWAHARALRPDLGEDWLDDVQADIAVARAVNGLPPH